MVHKLLLRSQDSGCRKKRISELTDVITELFP